MKLLLFVLTFSCFLILISTEQCVHDKTVTSIHPYCNNATRTQDYLLHSNNVSTFTCSDTAYTNVRFQRSATGWKQNGYTACSYGTNQSGCFFMTCTQNGLESAECATLCKAEDFFHNRTKNQNQTNILCTGTANYCWYQSGNTTCTNFGGVYTNPQCYCDVYKITAESITYLAKGTTYCSANGSIAAMESTNDVFNKESVTTPVKEITGAYIEFNGKTITARTGTSCNCYLVAKKEDWISHTRFDGLSIDVTVPDFVLIKSGILYVTILDDDGSEEDKQFPINGNVLCRIHDCILCPEAFKNWKCLPSTIKWTIGVMITMLVILIFCAFPTGFFLLIKFIIWILGFLIKTGRIPMRFARSKGMMKLRKLFSNLKSEVYDPVDVEAPKSDAKDVSEPVNKKNSNSNSAINNSVPLNKTSNGKFKTKLNSPITLTTILLYLLPLTLAMPTDWGCSEVIDISGTITSCTGVYPTRRNCSMSFENQITFNKPMQKMCRTFKDSNQRKVGYLEVSLIQVEQVVNLNSIYFTSDYKVTSETAHRCYGASTCTNSSCNSLQTRNAGGELNLNDLIFYPGKTICERRAGCAANGCLLCVDGCVYTGYALVPEGPVYQIYEPYLIYDQPKLLFNYTSGDNINTVKTISIDTVWSDIGLWNVQIIGDLISDQIEFEDYKIATDGRDHYLTRANDVNKFEPRLIGDIQANNADDLEFPGVNFAFAYQNYVFQAEGKGDSVVSELSGISFLDKKDKLPKEQFGLVWAFDVNGKLVANKTRDIAVQFVLTSNSLFNFSDYTTTVCPKFVSYQTSGCYDCNIGSNINITLQSICEEGLVDIYSDDLDVTILTSTFQISKFVESYMIEILTTKADNNFNLIITSGYHNISVPISFEAVSLSSVITNDTLVYDYDQEEPTHSGIGGSIAKYFDEAFLGRGHWITYLIIGTIASITVITIIYLVKKNKQIIMDSSIYRRMSYRKKD